MNNLLSDLIKKKDKNITVGAVVTVDSDIGRIKARIQGNNTIWVSCNITVEVGDSVLIYNDTTKSVLQKLSNPSATQVTLLKV